MLAAQPSMNEEGQPSTGAIDQQQVEATRQAPPSLAPRNGVAVPNRRRHSSHGVEAQYIAPDRVARSVSPGTTGHDSLMSYLPADDSDDDFLGIWRSRNGNGGRSNDADDSDSDELSDIMSEAEDEEEEEDDPNEIVLFGHR